MLSRLAAPQRVLASSAISTPNITTRTITTTIRTLNDNNRRPYQPRQQNQKQEQKVRVNPLIGNRAPPPPVSTEHPKASKTPSPSRVPFSSAEVPPNADIPPPPPAATEMVDISVPSSSSSSSKLLPNGQKKEKHLLDTGKDEPFLDVIELISKKAAKYVDELEDPRSKLRVHTRPVTGRTVFLYKDPKDANLAMRMGISASSVPGAFKVLQRAVVKGQMIKGLSYKQKWHERPGKKRKRLASENWRRRFKDGFKATTSRALELKKQGW